MTTNSVPDGRWIYMRWIARAFSLILLVPVVMLIAFVLITPITITGLLYLLGTVALVLGICSIAWGYTKFRRLLWLGVSLIVVVVVIRLLLLNTGDPIKQLILPTQSTVCVVSCIFDEQDVALFSTRVLSIIGWVSPAEQSGLLDAMYARYQAMASGQRIIPSPFVRTYFGQQNPGAFDAVIVEPEANQPAQMGVIFLHGFTGNFTMPCWLIAQAVTHFDAVTICPSVGWEGYWWTADGEATLRATIDYLHKRGVSRIYLAGLSNGAVGASELAYKLTDEIAGLILICGASPDATDSGLPVLVLAGSNDERMPADMLRGYADRMGTKATFVEFPGDHFMLAKQYQDIQNKIDSWLRQANS